MRFEQSVRLRSFSDISVGMCDLILLWQRVISAYGPKHEHHHVAVIKDRSDSSYQPFRSNC